MIEGSVMKELTLLLKRIQETADTLGEVLKQEQTILQAGDAHLLTDNTENKNIQLQQLEQLEQQRVQLMQQADLPSTPETMDNILQQQRGDLTLSELWHDIQKTVQKCQQLNEENGELIRQRSAQLNQAIDFIFSPPEKNLYSGESNAKPSISGNLLGSA